MCRAGARAVGAGLALLWLSGIAFLVLYAANQPQALENPKLWAKITVVSVLTVNGMFLHRRVFASMEEGRGWTPQGDLLRRYSILVAVSVASWVTATLLGTVKELNGVAPYATLLGLYGLAIAAAVALVEALRLPDFFPRSEFTVCRAFGKVQFRPCTQKVYPARHCKTR